MAEVAAGWGTWLAGPGDLRSVSAPRITCMPTSHNISAECLHLFEVRPPTAEWPASCGSCKRPVRSTDVGHRGSITLAEWGLHGTDFPAGYGGPVG